MRESAIQSLIVGRIFMTVVEARTMLCRTPGWIGAERSAVGDVERAIEDHIPAEFQHHAHHWLILHGRYTCVARKPKCAACLIRDLCQFEDKNL